MSQNEIRIALTRLVELAEFELVCPACPDPPEGWRNGLKEAVQTTRQFLSEIRPDPGPFFLSAENRRHKYKI